MKILAKPSRQSFAQLRAFEFVNQLLGPSAQIDFIDCLSIGTQNRPPFWSGPLRADRFEFRN
jgi:hypothetical protein